jgi:hypothetical protein
MTMWDDIAEKISAREGGKGASGRSCREKYETLYRAATVKRRTHSSRSGDHEEKWETIDELLFECIEMTEAHEQEIERAKARDAKRIASVTQRQSELKEETMQSLAGRRRTTDESVSTSSTSGTDAEGKDRGKKKKRADMRSLMVQSLEQNRVQFERQEAATQAFTDTVDKRMAESNALFAQLIANMKKG